MPPLLRGGIRAIGGIGAIGATGRGGIGGRRHRQPRRRPSLHAMPLELAPDLSVELHGLALELASDLALDLRSLPSQLSLNRIVPAIVPERERALPRVPAASLPRVREVARGATALY